jgi:chemotaxis protein MotA
MDRTSIGGLILAIAAVLVGQSLDGGEIASLIQPSAFIVVFFGTLGAVLLQTRMQSFVLAVKLLRDVFVLAPDDRLALARRVTRWSVTARKEGTLRLERDMEQEAHPVAKKGLRLIIDGVASYKLKEMCMSDLHLYESKQRSAIKVWDSAGGYSPTIGILAAVMGLMHVMEKLADPSLLGSGIAVAFVATIYGVGLANLFFIPIANKLKTLTQSEIEQREVLIEALVSIAEGEHTLIIEDRLNAYAAS